MRLSSRLRALCSVVALAVVSFGPLTSPAAADSATPRPHVTLGVFEPDSGATLADHLRSYTSVAGEAPEVVNYFTDWNPKPFPAESVDVIAATGATPLISWLPTTYADQHSTSLPGMLSKIADGADDDYIRAWATAAKSFGSTIYLRLAHEMNGGWYAWGRGVNGNTADDYIAMYRHVHDIFEQVGATNVKWVWTPNAMWNSDTSNPQPFYPGSGYVDVVGLDGYNWGTDGTGSWVSFSSIFSLTLRTLPSFAPDKPVWIIETGSTEHGGDKAAWLLDMFQTLISDQRISGLIYFDTVGTADWRLATSTDSIAAYGQGVAALRAAEAPASTTSAPTSTTSAPTSSTSASSGPASSGPASGTSASSAPTSSTPTSSTPTSSAPTSSAPTTGDSTTSAPTTSTPSQPTVKVAQLAAHTKKERSVRVSGRVPSGAAVRITRRVGGHWHPLRTVRPNRSGHYATKVRLPRAKVTLRVQAAPSAYRIVRVTVR